LVRVAAAEIAVQRNGQQVFFFPRALPPRSGFPFALRFFRPRRRFLTSRCSRQPKCGRSRSRMVFIVAGVVIQPAPSVSPCALGSVLRRNGPAAAVLIALDEPTKNPCQFIVRQPSLSLVDAGRWAPLPLLFVPPPCRSQSRLLARGNELWATNMLFFLVTGCLLLHRCCRPR